MTIDEHAQAYRGAMPSENGCRASVNGFLAMSSETYLKLLDWTGRQLRSDGKRGRIPPVVAPILKRLGISSGVWCDESEAIRQDLPARRWRSRVIGSRSSTAPSRLASNPRLAAPEHRRLGLNHSQAIYPHIDSGLILRRAIFIALPGVAARRRCR